MLRAIYAFIISLLTAALLACALLWARSYLIGDGIYWSYHRNFQRGNATATRLHVGQAYIGRGDLTVRINPGSDRDVLLRDPQLELSWSSQPSARSPYREVGLRPAVSFAGVIFLFEPSVGGAKPVLVMPLYLPTLLLAIAPALALVRALRRRRLADRRGFECLPTAEASPPRLGNPPAGA